MTLSDRRYMLIRMNDGGLPVITFHDSVDETNQLLSYVQHWMVIDQTTGDTVALSDNPTEVQDE